jgi:serine/threonine protein phosphatase PrpC
LALELKPVAAKPGPRQKLTCAVGSSEMRAQNEDRWSLVADVAPGRTLLGVYDGHGGNEAAHFLQQVRVCVRECIGWTHTREVQTPLPSKQPT